MRINVLALLILFLTTGLCTNRSKGQSMNITIGNKTFHATLYDNPTANAFKEMLPITINMSELNSNEKYFYLSNNLPTTSSSPKNIKSGDIMLFGSNCFVLFYEDFSSSYSYSKIGYINNPLELREALGENSVSITFELLSSSSISQDKKIDNQNFHIYPTIVRESLFVEGKFKRLTLRQMNGNVTAYSDKSPLILSSLQKGVYFLSIETDNDIYYQKIIKQ